MRSFLAVLLVLVATALTFPATLAAWQQRVLMNEPSFVELGNDVLGKEPVQAALAERIASEVTAAEPRIDAARSRSIAQAFLRDLPDSPIAETALSTTHRLLVRLIQDGDLDVDGVTIILDLSPVVREVLADAGLSAAPLPQDAGRIALVRSDDLTATLRVARFLDDVALLVVAAPAVALLLAILVAPGRSALLVFAGMAIALAAGARLLLLKSEAGERLIDAALLDAEARAAAAATYDVLVASFVRQELVFALIGGVLFGIGVVGTLVKASRS